MVTSNRGIEFIKAFESCRLTAYKALPQELYYTIGYGHCGPDVTEGMTIPYEWGLQRWTVWVIDHLCECRDPPHHSKPQCSHL